MVKKEEQSYENDAENGAPGSIPGRPLKDYDPSNKGPIRNRSCTDIICCLIFIVFVALLTALGVFAYVWGDPKLLLYPMDSKGNLCGYGNQRGKDKLFFFDLVQCGKLGPGVFVQGCPTPQVCRSACPDNNFFYVQNLPTGGKNGLICQDHVDTSTKSLQALIEDKDCAAYYLKSTSILNRCIPLDNFAGAIASITGGGNLTDNENNTITSGDLNIGMKAFKAFLEAKEFAEKIISDIVATWPLIIGALIITMLVSLIWIALLRWVAGFMVWSAVLLFVGLFAALTGVCFWQYYETKDSGETYTIHMVILMTFSKESFFLVLGIITAIIFIIIVLILLFLCQRIQIAIQLIKEGSRAIGNMLFTLVWPIIPFILQLAVVGLWLSIAINAVLNANSYLASIGRAQKLASDNTTLDAVKEKAKDLFEEIPCDSNSSDALGKICGVIKYGDGEYTFYMQIFNLFMGFWLMNFVIALGQITLAGAFASYYWAFNKDKDIPTFPLMSALYRALRYHLGSLAFGSLLIAIVQLIRIFLEYLDSQLKGSENPAAKFFMKCLKCCFWCLEKFLKFISKNAYIMIAIYGKNFCVSAKNAFSLILRNVIRVAVVDKVTDFVLFLSRLVIIGAVGTGTYFFFDGRIPYLEKYKPTLNFYLVPIVIVLVGSYLITSVFFSVYSMAVDTLFLCFLEDLERNNGSPEKPYFMSKGLMKVLGKKNKTPARGDE